MRRCTLALIATVLITGPLAAAFAQLGGSRAGVAEPGGRSADLAALPREVAESFITVDGRAELRIAPSEIRMVLAVTSEGETAAQCQDSIRETIGSLRQGWSKSNLGEDDVVEDFIAVLPRYEWDIEKRNEVEVGIEKKVGYRMQTNLHVAVPNDRVAKTVLAVAFEQGVTDIIAFDYWSDDLDSLKVKARQQALRAAREKADFLLDELLDSRPPAINVQEQTTVHWPESLYQSFVNSVDQQVSPAPRRDVPLIGAARPKNTYYRGLNSTAVDRQPGGLPMQPEITVVSTVRVYYESPVAHREAPKALKAKPNGKRK